MPRYKLLPAAEHDLESIWRYTVDQWRVEQVLQYLDGLDEAFNVLANTPMMCRERREFVPPVRIYHHAKHLIVYLAEDTHITIVRVLHEHMDIEGQLNDPA